VNAPLIATIRDALTDSELLRTVAAIRQDDGAELAFPDSVPRSLSDAEIRQLQELGNRADDWRTLRVCDPFDPQRIRGCRFHGQVALGRFTGAAAISDGVTLPTGVYDSTLIDCVVGDEALVQDVSLLANFVVARKAVLFDCGRVTSSPDARFGNGMVLNVGPQMGGRRLPVFAEIAMDSAARCVSDLNFLDDHSRDVAAYAERAASPKGFIGENSRLLQVGRVERSYVGSGCRIDGASQIVDSTLLGGPDEVTSVAAGASVLHSIVQWGCDIGPGAVVERSLVMEHAHVGRQGKVAESVIGPNSAIAVGEVTSCLIGPFVGAHHQSLLISLLWPLGRGNVAHGANVGSNHTTRCADQECWPGEGMFFGLGVNVKFPVNFSRAPFCVVAAGTNLPPQRVEFPFSLIAPPATPRSELPLTHNEIRPGWMLDQNLYALRRLEAKHESRNRARRTGFEFSVLRCQTVEHVRTACQRLRSVPQIQAIYSENEIPGLGKNLLTEDWRRRAIDAYRGALSIYALNGLRQQIATALSAERHDWIASLLHESDVDPVWEQQRSIVVDDLGMTDPVKGLWQLAALLEVQATLLEVSRKKDHDLGRRILDDYDVFHPPIGDDDLIRATREQVERDRNEIHQLIACIESPVPVRVKPKLAKRMYPVRERA
jgi:hypothetical protein